MPLRRTFINSRADFFRVVDEALDMTADRLSQTVFAPLASIARQLEAIKAWTAGGREPTLDERRKVSIGLIATRELEPAASADDAAYLTRLYEIDGYFSDWLSDAELLAFDDADWRNDFPLG